MASQEYDQLQSPISPTEGSGDFDSQKAAHQKQETLSGLSSSQLMELIEQKNRENACLELLKALHVKKTKLLEKTNENVKKARKSARKSGTGTGAATTANATEGAPKPRKSLFENLGLAIDTSAAGDKDRQRLEHLSELIFHIETYYAAVQESPSTPAKKSGRKSVLDVDSNASANTEDLDLLFTNVVLKTYRVHGIEKDWPHRGPSHVLDALELFIEKFPGYQLQYKAESEKWAWQGQLPQGREDQPNVASNLGELVGGPEVDMTAGGHSKAVSDLGGMMDIDHQQLSAHQRAPSSRVLIER